MEAFNTFAIEGKGVLLRTDYDVPMRDGSVTDDTRIQASLPTIHALFRKNARSVTILCHIDRPGGKVVESLRVAPVTKLLMSLLPKDTPVVVEENLRFNEGEEKNDEAFAQKLAAKGDVYVNDAFAASHRNHASIVSLPKLLPSAIGIHFTAERRALDKVRKDPRRPLIVVIGGAKLETKLPLMEKLTRIADEILVGGKLAQEVSSKSQKTLERMFVAELTETGGDISEDSAQRFAQKIGEAGTVVWNGPMGIYEEEKTSQGTRVIAQAINDARGYTVIGGGDTEAAATKFNAEAGIDHISMGGGAMLQYLAEGTLPGIEAIK